MKLGDVIILAVLALILFLAIVAIIRGHDGMKKSKSFDSSDKKVKFGYWLVSVIHMLAGVLITLCYVIAGVFLLTNYLGG